MSTAHEIAYQQFPVRDLKGLRASELARCPRMAAYRHSETPEEPTDLERRYFARGRMFGEFVARQLELRYGRDAVEFEMPIPWEHGVAHPDIFVRPERMFVEVKSTVAPSGLVFEMAVWQVRIYIRLKEREDAAAQQNPLAYERSAYRGQVYLINPSKLTREEAIPVELHDEHRDLIDGWIAELDSAVAGGPLPDRVCEKPSDARSRLCPFAETCFAGWEPVRTPIDDEKIARLAFRHFELAEDERRRRREADELKAERQQVEAELAVELDPGEHQAGDLVVRRTHVAARERFDLARARKAGVWDRYQDRDFAPFISETGEHDRWKTTRVETVAGEYDEPTDEVPF